MQNTRYALWEGKNSWAMRCVFLFFFLNDLSHVEKKTRFLFKIFAPMVMAWDYLAKALITIYEPSSQMSKLQRKTLHIHDPRSRASATTLLILTHRYPLFSPAQSSSVNARSNLELYLVNLFCLSRSLDFLTRAELTVLSPRVDL